MLQTQMLYQMLQSQQNGRIEKQILRKYQMLRSQQNGRIQTFQ